MIHGTSVSIYGVGILIIGKSGSGKSDLAMRLCFKGANLIADDQVCLEKHENQILMSCPDSLSGLLEVRGLGICAVDHPVDDSVNHDHPISSLNLSPIRLKSQKGIQSGIDDKLGQNNKIHNHQKVSLDLILDLTPISEIPRLPDYGVAHKDLKVYAFEGFDFPQDVSVPKYQVNAFEASWYEKILILVQSILDQKK